MQAIILAGGLSRRLGGVPKAGLLLDGQTLLARTVDAAADFLAAEPATSIGDGRRPAPIVVVGPVDRIAEWLATAKSGAATVAVQEDPPFAGPAAGIAAGLSALTEDAGDAGYVLVLACDMPHAGAIVELLAPKLASCAPGEGVMAVADGRKQPLAAIYPLAELHNAVGAARAAHRLENASVFSLIANVNIKECAVPSGLAADIDTWADARAQGMGAGPADAEGQQLENHDEALQAWTKKLLEAFEIADIDVDVDAVLNLAGVAAHSIVRPAAPLTTFVAGLAAGLAAGTGQASEATAMAAALGLARKLAAAEAHVEPAAAVPPVAPDAQTPAGN
ncbi:NTP transferase domain-containing protein [Arthrobacter sp. TWP1-1]|uniref:NTP transferase domain-containing protein n=1 Tax=Arthrobacter sp. TWP1-1 TaxID=2804568 RepID=UPI003CEFBE06